MSHEALIGQYRSLIHTAVLESEKDHQTTLKIGKLSSKLRVICKAAEYEGLPGTAICQLIDEVMPVTSAKTI